MCAVVSSTQVANDVLLPKHQKKALATEAQWEDVKVSQHVVLRTAKPTAAPRVPQLIVNPPSYDSVSACGCGYECE